MGNEINFFYLYAFNHPESIVDKMKCLAFTYTEYEIHALELYTTDAQSSSLIKWYIETRISNKDRFTIF